MNRLRNIVGLIAVCATAAFFTGCGESDSSSSGTPTSNAPDTLNNKTYSLTDSGTGGQISFDAAANNYTLVQGGVTENGTFTANRSGDVWNVTVVNDTGTNTSQLTLTFTGSGVGTYTFQRPGESLATGSFAASSGSTTTGGTTTTTGGTTTTTGGTTTTTGGTTTTTGGTTTTTGGTTTTTGGTTTTTGGTTTTTGGTTTGGGTVPAPTTLSTISVITGAGSGVGEGAHYTVTFTGGASGNFQAVNSNGEPSGNGTYNYTPQGNQAHLRMDYGGSFAGDFDDMTLIFTTAPGGGSNNYTGTQRVTGVDYPFNGTFTY